MSESKDKKSQLFLLKNAFYKDYKFSNKEILQNVHWLRHIISIIVGIVMGVLSVTGYPGFIAYLVSTCGFVAFYYSKFLEIDEDEFKWELLQEGFMSSLTLFAFSWILLYNILHV
ncbi:hypothetical protein DICPUDRAFT_85616 [Dictyostelium purpureum]|uniref:Rab5-interacting protein n=1 Tax=Dictyostelium purpureum TaxID=5786 RepID=F1A6A4_DICPU|nr:uncharacterized protein DICPUDRAFT_85616 [Dictyostelium purpureum]EGC28278.1 hypothetical protein DICPUDRAFT_85616 [Dictyostelium purpureum]|eukprot:XP_003295198.1 hypothetical protein DICPUDRAFT_85616 [Dictyostelium purpureum]